MIPLIVGAAGAAFNAFNAIRSANAAKREMRRAERQLDNSANVQRNYYNRELYQNYFDKADTQNALRSLNENMDRQKAIADGSAAVTGATPEAQLAAGASRGKAISDAHASIAGQGMNYKSMMAKQLADMETRYANSKASLHGQKAANHSTAMSNAIGGLTGLASNLASTLMPTVPNVQSVSGQLVMPAPRVDGSAPRVNTPELDFLKETPKVEIPS